MLGYQKDLLTKRWRKIRAPEPTEFQLQSAVMKQFAWRKRDGVTGWHCPNGGLRNPIAAAKLKAMGTLPGVADLQFIWGELVAAPSLIVLPRVLFLELKRKGGRQAPAQKAFAVAVTKAGCCYEVADSVDAAMAVLERHGLLR